jgi:hypothetical protein
MHLTSLPEVTPAPSRAPTLLPLKSKPGPQGTRVPSYPAHTPLYHPTRCHQPRRKPHVGDGAEGGGLLKHHLQPPSLLRVVPL